MKGIFVLSNLLLFSLILQNHLAYTYTAYTPIARYLKVPESDVPKLLAQEKTLVEGNRIVAPLVTKNEQIFGGSYIDIIANKININTKNLSESGIITNNPAMKPYLNLLSFIQAKNSLYDLNSTFEDLTTLAIEDNATNVMLSNEYIVNNIVIYLSHSDDIQSKEFIADAIKLNPIIIYDEFDESKIEVMKNHSNPNAPNPNAPPKPPLQVYVLGGDGIHNSEFSAFCTAGFWVGSKSNSTFYLMTAAHCSKRGPFNPDGTVDFYHLPWGSEGGGLLVGSMFAPNMSAIEVDMGLIMKQNNRISVTPSVRNTDDQEFPELRIYGIVEMDTVRTLVCKSAYITHATCGKIISFNVRVINQSGREFNGLIKIEELSCQGESGAPLFPFVEEMFPGIFITGMITSGKVGSACYAVPIGRLITGDMYILTVNDLI